jgi:hypothetical protein
VSARRRVAVVVVLAAAALAVVAVNLTRSTPTGLERVRAALHDDDRFVNGPTAGETFAKASRWLLDDGSACEREHGRGDPRCRVRLSAAAYTGVAAAGVLSCTAPGVYRTRTALVEYISAIDSFDHHALGTQPVPAPPRAPAC